MELEDQPYTLVSSWEKKKENTAEMELEDQPYILVTLKEGSDDIMELPQETDGTVLMSTLQCQFPTAVGLKFKSSTGGWRGIRAENNILHPPFGGWDGKTFIVTESAALKRKPDPSEDSREKSSSSRSSSNRDNNRQRSKQEEPEKPRSKNEKLLDDLIVLGLPYGCTAETLKEYFTNTCGTPTFCELKEDGKTGKSRGFGFVRFDSVEAAMKAMNEPHEIEGRKLVVRLSQRKGDIPTKLFIGKLPESATEDDVREYFSEYGQLADCFVPTPFRGFGFVTYVDEEDAKRVLKRSHHLKETKILVTPAESKTKREEDRKREKEKEKTGFNNNRNNNWNKTNDPYGDPYRNDSYGGNYGSGGAGGGGSGAAYSNDNYYSANSYGAAPGATYQGDVGPPSYPQKSRMLPQSYPQKPRMLPPRGNSGPTSGFSCMPPPGPSNVGRSQQLIPQQQHGGDVVSEVKDMLLTLINNQQQRNGAPSGR